MTLTAPLPHKLEPEFFRALEIRKSAPLVSSRRSSVDAIVGAVHDLRIENHMMRGQITFLESVSHDQAHLVEVAKTFPERVSFSFHFTSEGAIDSIEIAPIPK